MVYIHTDAITQPNAVRLLVRGQLDLTAVSAFNTALTRAARMRRPVQLHLAGVDFIDGSGLSMLMNACSRARRAGYELTIAAASREVSNLIDITDTAARLPPLLLGHEHREVRPDKRLAPTAPETGGGTPAFRT